MILREIDDPEAAALRRVLEDGRPGCFAVSGSDCAEAAILTRAFVAMGWRLVDLGEASARGELRLDWLRLAHPGTADLSVAWPRPAARPRILVVPASPRRAGAISPEYRQAFSDGLHDYHVGDGETALAHAFHALALARPGIAAGASDPVATTTLPPRSLAERAIGLLIAAIPLAGSRRSLSRRHARWLRARRATVPPGPHPLRPTLLALVSGGPETDPQAQDSSGPGR